jgi:hypothetical protein
LEAGGAPARSLKFWGFRAKTLGILETEPGSSAGLGQPQDYGGLDGGDVFGRVGHGSRSVLHPSAGMFTAV